MAVSAKIYSKYIYHILCADTTHGWTSGTIKCMLCTDGYTPAQTSHEYKSSVTSEVSATNGYSAGGVTCGSVTVTTSTTTTTCDAADAQWTNATISARYAVLYDNSTSTNDAGKLLIGYVDFDGTQSSSSGTFTVQWNASGILQISCA